MVWFESFANSERYKTVSIFIVFTATFESFANSERYKTIRLMQELLLAV